MTEREKHRTDEISAKGAASERTGRRSRLALLFAGALVSLFPFYWMWVAGTHPSGEVLRVPPPLWTGGASWENLKGLQESISLTRVLFNSLFIATSYAAVGTLISAMAGLASPSTGFAAATPCLPRFSGE